MEFKTKAELLERAKLLVGKQVGEIEIVKELSNNKGGVGNAIEEGWFGVKNNNRAEPDFAELGIELKVTPIIKNKKKYASKERLVLNIINYMDEVDKTFDTSSFWKKNKELLLVFYEYKKDEDKRNYEVIDTFLYCYPEEDLAIIKKDWEIIHSYIVDGKAEELSERLTTYLSACTKGAKATDVRDQPNSDIRAKQRAFSLKQSYMTNIVNHYVIEENENEKIIKDPLLLSEVGFDDYLITQTRKYIGRTAKDLCEEFNVKFSDKAKNQSLISRMFNCSGNISNTEEFKKSGIIVKTLTICENKNNLKENMSFATFKFKDLIEEKWEDSWVYNYFYDNRFMFCIFQLENGEEVFKGIKMWGMPYYDITGELKLVWENTINVIKNGVVIEQKGNQYTNNLPKSKDSRIAHIRPHANKRAYKFEDGTEIGDIKKDANELPDGRWMSTQCFWLNSKYILEQVKEFAK